MSKPTEIEVSVKATKANKNREIIREQSPIHADVMEMFKEQLLICLLRRLGADNGTVKIPVAEVDGTGNYNLSLAWSIECFTLN